MIHFVFSEKDLRYLFLKFDTSDDERWLKHNENNKKQPNLTDHLNLVDPICYLKTYTGPKFTQDFLFEYLRTDGQKIYYCSIGLWQEVYKFFKKNNVKYDGLEPRYLKREMKHTYQEFKEIVKSWNLSLEPREYQYKSAYKILEWRRSVSELATRAGKTLIAYLVFRYSIEYLGMKKILAIVPSISLVKQMYNDFNEYAEFFKTECIWSGGKLVESSNFTVGTFQSLIKFLDKKSKKYNPKFFDDFDCVFVDETHRATANQIRTIISQSFMKDVIIAFGMTGTLPHEKTIERYCVHSLLGAKIQEISTYELKSKGYISDIQIYQYRLNYSNIQQQIDTYIKCAEYSIGNYVEELRQDNRHHRVELPPTEQRFLIKYVKNMPYGIQLARANIYNDTQKSKMMKDIEWMNTLQLLISDSTGSNSLFVERMMIHFMPERIDFLCNEIIPQCTKNTLILCHHTEYINYLVDVLNEKFGSIKLISKITGKISPKKREKILKILRENNNCLLVASYGCLSTGITLANLCYGVLFESFKSDVVNMQSIGRGLGLSELKDKYRLFDIVDCFDNKITNKIFLQGLARIKIYERDFNQHKYEIHNYNLGVEDRESMESFRIAYDIFKSEEGKQKTKKSENIDDENTIFNDI